MTSPPARIDAHHHVWDLDRRPQPWTDGLPALRRSFGYDELVPALDDAGIDATVLVHTVASFDETLEMLALAATHQRIAGVVGWLDLSGAGVADQIAEARSAPGGRRLVGARHQLQEEPDPRWLARPAVHAGLRALAAAGLAYDVVVSAHQLPVVIEAVRALPEVRFVLDHAGKPPIAAGELDDWRHDIAELATAPNVAVKLSGLVTEADWARWTVAQLRPVAGHVLASFGPERTMFGSDWPVCLLAAGYAAVVDAAAELTADLDEAAAQAVWGGTARTWYRLETA